MTKTFNLFYFLKYQIYHFKYIKCTTKTSCYWNNLFGTMLLDIQVDFRLIAISFNLFYFSFFIQCMMNVKESVKLIWVYKYLEILL